MTSEYRRYAYGGTSWLGYLASAGRRDRSEERRELHQDLRDSDPDSAYWQRQAETLSSQCEDLIPADRWNDAMDLLPDFAERTWMWQVQGFRALLAAVTNDRNLTAGQMADVFLRGN